MLARTGEPTAPHVGPGAQRVALSPDGGNLAVLRTDGDTAELALTTASASDGEVVARDLDATYGALTWSDDGRQLFYTGKADGSSWMRVGRYDLAAQRWEIETLPIEGGFAAIAVSRTTARSFFAERLVAPSDCPGAGRSYPSGRQGVCTFAFFTADSPDE